MDLTRSLRKTENILEIPQPQKVAGKRLKYLKQITSVLLLLVIFSTYFIVKGKSDHVEALPFGLGNNYDEISALNDKFASTVPMPIESITTTQSSAEDKRVIALYKFLKQRGSPMATMNIAKAFIDNADKNGFSSSWYILPAISGIESGFGRVITRTDTQSSYNAWGWSGGSKHSRWSYFNSWEHAIEVISRGMARGYGVENLKNPNRIMAIYCPPCASGKGNWSIRVNGFITELNRIHKELES